MSRRFAFWQLALLVVIGLEVAAMENAYTRPPAKPVVVEHFIPARIGTVQQTTYVCGMTSSPCLIADGSNINQQAVVLARHARLPAPPRHK